MSQTADVVIVGSGMGGASAAYGLAPSGADILILEKGHPLPEQSENRDARAIFQRGFFLPEEEWFDAAGRAFRPGNYYFHGGNTKFYGAVLMRYRESDFDGVEHLDGVAPKWPFRYAELAPWYDAAERLFNVRGALGEDPSEPAHGEPYPFPPVPDEPSIAEVRQRMKKAGLHPFSLPLGVDIDAWLAEAATPWDAFPNARGGKMDAETCALLPALEHPNVRIESGAEVLRLLTEGDGPRVQAVEYSQNGEIRRVTAGTVVLAAGAVRSAKVLLASSNEGLANASGAVGRYFMNHNLTATLAVDPRFNNTSVYQKTFAMNDFYHDDGKGGPPLGHMQLLGRVSGAILKGKLKWVPEMALGAMTRHSVDVLLMSEDLPDPESRIRLDGDRVIAQWKRSNLRAHELLRRRAKERFRAAGFPLVLSRAFDRDTPSHQCGTIRIGEDPATAPLDAYGRAFDHPNLFVSDASCLVTSAAVNPSLTISALALRTADHIRKTVLRA